MTSRALAVIWVMVMAPAAGVVAQHTPAEDSLAATADSHHHGTSNEVSASDTLVASFVATARAATQKYQDLDAAVAAGYRLVGPDFPGMGEHWVHLRRVVQRDLDAERPAVLSYLRVDGIPILTGVAYAQPVRSGEDPADFVVPGLWHFHSGSIDEETLLLNPRSMHHADEDQPRLAMLHAWIWAENPDGMFAQDNWALPFLRLNLPIPEAPPPQAGKALFLLTDGVGYYATLIDVAGAPSEPERAGVRAILERTHQEVAEQYRAMLDVGVVSPSHLAELTASWHAMWEEIERTVSPELWARIEMLSG